MNGWIVLGSAIVGLLVGATGAGGGALMTPMLILLFGVTPSTAISSDLVAAVLMRPVGAAVHLRRGTVNLPLVGWLSVGSVPGAFLGAYLLHLFGHGSEDTVELALGSALLLGAAAMGVRYLLDWHSGQARRASVTDLRLRRPLTVAVGLAGGLVVGITSVGSGSLMIVMLLFLYPAIGARQLVGTDLTQAMPLTLSAALGALAFGHIQLSVTASLVVGSVPAVVVGSWFSSRAPERLVRPVIGLVILASGLKYVGMSPAVIGGVTGGVALGAAVVALVRARRAAPAGGRSPAPAGAVPTPADDPAAAVVAQEGASSPMASRARA